MDDAEHRTFSLSRDEARFIDAVVDRGVYPTGDAVVRAALRALRTDEEAFTAAADVFGEIRKLHLERLAMIGPTAAKDSGRSRRGS